MRNRQQIARLVDLVYTFRCSVAWWLVRMAPMSLLTPGFAAVASLSVYLASVTHTPAFSAAIARRFSAVVTASLNAPPHSTL